MRQIITHLFEHMLLIDYGIDQTDDLRLDLGLDCHKRPDIRREFDGLCVALVQCVQSFPLRYCHMFAECLLSICRMLDALA